MNPVGPLTALEVRMEALAEGWDEGMKAAEKGCCCGCNLEIDESGKPILNPYRDGAKPEVTTHEDALSQILSNGSATLVSGEVVAKIDYFWDDKGKQHQSRED